MIRKLAKLPASDVRLLARAGGIVPLVRLCLWLIPPRILLRYVARRVEGVGPTGVVPDHSVRRIGWAVRAVSRRVPYATCLTQALAAQILLARAGYMSQLRIGVAREEAGGFVAHAWVELEGCVLVGGRGVDRYQPLPDVLPLL